MRNWMVNEELSRIIMDNMVCVDVHQEQHQLKGFDGIMHRMPGRISYTGKMTIRNCDPASSYMQMLNDWLHGGQKMDVGRFKGLFPMQMDIDYFSDSINITFSMDYISAPNTIDDLMPWELSQVSTQSKASIRAMYPERPKKKKEDHFDKELFEI